jgi:hypothetical protein
LSDSVQKRRPFLELLDRHGRILVFQATEEDYRALGWRDLTWGLTLNLVLSLLYVWDRLDLKSFASSGAEGVIRLCLLGLEWVFVAFLLRPKNISGWRAVPLATLAGVTKGLFFLLLAWGVEAEQRDLAFNTFWSIISAWQAIIFMLFLQDGMRFRLQVALVAAFIPMLARLTVILGIPLYVLLPVLLIYLFHVVRAWRPSRTQRDKVDSCGESESHRERSGDRT